MGGRHTLADSLSLTPDPPTKQNQSLAAALAPLADTEEAEVSWLSPDEAEGGAVVRVAERGDIPAALDQQARRMPWDRRCVGILRLLGWDWFIGGGIFVC